jgi:hypothetical protein
MSKSETTPLFFFSSFLMHNTLVYEARNTTLARKRDYFRCRSFFNLLIKYLNQPSQYNETHFEKELLILTLPIHISYLSKLIKKFNAFSVDALKKDLDYLKSEIKIPFDELQLTKNVKLQEYRNILNKSCTLITKYESQLNIKSSSVINTEKIVHTAKEVYKLEHDKLKNILMQAIEALKYFDKELQGKPALYGQEKRQNIDYLITVVYFELWNFISHISHATADTFKCPTLYIDDLEKAMGHLRRCTMDIYDGLIVDLYFDRITVEYLNIRHNKILSLGSYDNMQNLTEALKKYYLEIKQTPKLD